MKADGKIIKGMAGGLLLLALAGSAWGAVGASRAQFRHENGFSALSLDFPQVVSYKMFTLTAPYRLVIDIGNAAIGGRLGALANRQPPAGSQLAAIRVARQPGDTVRVVLEFKGEPPVLETAQAPSGRSFSLRLQWGAPSASPPPPQ